MKKVISKVTDIICLLLGLTIFTLMPYEVFGLFGVIWFYFWGAIIYLFLQTKFGKRFIDWSISHD